MRDVGVNPSADAHLAVASGPLRFFVVAPSADERKICLAVVKAGATVNTCTDVTLLAPDDVVWISRANPRDVYDLYGLAPNGIRTVQAASVRATVSNNVFFLRDVPASAEHIIVTGPSVYRTIQIGKQVPEGATIAPDPSP